MPACDAAHSARGNARVGGHDCSGEGRGEEIEASFCRSVFPRRVGAACASFRRPAIPANERTEGAAAEKGEFSRWEFMDACWDYLNMSIDDAVVSDNPIIRSFAMLDKRLGKRRLKLIDRNGLHPLALSLLNLRLECEGLKSTEKEIKS